MPSNGDSYGYDDYVADDYPDYSYENPYVGYDGYDYSNTDPSNDGLNTDNWGNDNADVPFMGAAYDGPDNGTGDITQGNFGNYDWSQGANPDWNYNPDTGQVEYNPSVTPDYQPSDTYTDNNGDLWMAQQDNTYKNTNSGDVYDPVTGDRYTADEWYNNNLTSANPTAVDVALDAWRGELNPGLGMPPNNKGPSLPENKGSPPTQGTSGSLGGATTKPAETQPNNSLLNSLLGALGKVIGAAAVPNPTPKATVPGTTTPMVRVAPKAGSAQAGMTGLAGAKQTAQQVAKEAEALATPRNLTIAAVVVGGLYFMSRRNRRDYSSRRN